MDGSPIGLLLLITYGSSVPIITPNVYVYGVVDTDASPSGVTSGRITGITDTDGSPISLKNPLTSGNVNNRQGSQSTDTGSNSGMIQ